MIELWEDAMNQLNDNTPNGHIVAMALAGRNAMSVRSGRDIIQMYALSSRIREDLMRALEFEEAFDVEILLREWVPMNPMMEFRGFMYNRKLTAISQYCYYHFSQELVDRKEELKNLISDFFYSIVDRIPMDNAIVDFLVDGDQVLIIELNPFFADTGACLFDWYNDRELLKNGPLQMRVETAPQKDPYLCATRGWKAYMKRYRSRVIFSETTRYLPLLVVAMALGSMLLD
eukprot:TRINITY_DN6350_c0_g1_i1.p1 TRINITY_DN6350_c0_g1~~TRINITY_DN6350_c0_g1_i1.p1  ORF type:complete len:231 (-),score=48.90 TRINITY_DN6350_c0_g1_i1:50-742(-)